MNKVIKKTIVLGIILFGFITTLVSCNGNSVTLESMKTALTEAGYEISDDKWDDIEQDIVDGFIFISPAGAEIYSGIGIPVLEFKDETSANDYVKSVDDGLLQMSVVKGKFVAITYGIAGSPQKDFLEKLITGKPLTE